MTKPIMFNEQTGKVRIAENFMDASGFTNAAAASEWIIGTVRGGKRKMFTIRADMPESVRKAIISEQRVGG